MCLSAHLVSSMVCFVVVSNFLYNSCRNACNKKPLSERVNDDFWEIVEVTCTRKVVSGVELYVKSHKEGMQACVCDPIFYYQLWHL